MAYLKKSCCGKKAVNNEVFLCKIMNHILKLL
jgi:hypothetical protein